MSTAVAYRAPSDPDAHRSSASPHSLPHIPSSVRPSNGHNPSSPMSSSPSRTQTTLAPRASVEVVRANPISNGQSIAPAAQPENRSPQGSKPSQPSRSEGSDEQPIPSVEVKQERPPTPDPAKSGTASSSRHRPRKLDLSNSGPVPPGRPSAPMTSKDSAPLTAMQDIGLACLSPGFQTEDPRMTQQLQRSMDLREEQRRIIEARLQKGGKDGESSGSKGSAGEGPGSQTNSFSKPPGTSRRKGPPPGLSINAPSAQQFASEPRVIQSAPLNQTFTGLNAKSVAHPLSRQVLQNSHAQHHEPPERRTSASGATSSGPQYATYSPAQPSANRLPPIQDVFANENLGSSPYRPNHSLNRTNSGPGPSNNNNNNNASANSKNGGPLYAPLNAGGGNSSRSPNGTQYAAALPSPAYPPPQQSAGLQPPSSGRGREFKSAEDAVHSMSGAREEMLPKVVHYGGHQPPTPPSPLPPVGASHSSQGQGDRHYGSNAAKGDEGQTRSTSGRRRTRDEYERDFNEREAAEADRMDVDVDRERNRARHGPPSGRRATDSGITSAPSARNSGGVPGIGFGFGALGSDVGARQSPETIRRKKEEFLALCSRAWDLLHE